MGSLKLPYPSGNSAILHSPAANPSADITMKLPSTTGSAGQYLKVASANHSSTNAELEWGTVSSGLSSDAQYNTVGGTNAGDSFSGTDAEKNVLIVYNAGTAITTGDGNVCLGYDAGKAITTQSKNAMIGWAAGQAQAGDDGCICIGYQSARLMNGSSNGTFIGNNVAYSLTDGHDNTFIGAKSGWDVTTGDKNVCLGIEAGRGQITTEDNCLFIARDNVGSGNSGCWIFGDPSGNCYQGNNNASWNTSSDSRLKKNIVDNNVGLSVIEQIKVRNFEYKTETEIDRSAFGLTEDKVNDESDPHHGEYVTKIAIDKTGTQLGPIAQEIEKVLPNCVKTTSKGVKTVNTDELFWHMLNAIKELSTKVKALEAG